MVTKFWSAVWTLTSSASMFPITYRFSVMSKTKTFSYWKESQRILITCLYKQTFLGHINTFNDFVAERTDVDENTLRHPLCGFYNNVMRQFTTELKFLSMKPPSCFHQVCHFRLEFTQTDTRCHF